MAKQREQRRQGNGAAGGRTALGLAVIAAVAVGGFLLYRHTAPFQGPRETAEQRSAPTTLVPSAAAPAGRPAEPLAGQGGARPSENGTAMEPSVSAPGGKRQLPSAPFGESEEVFETGAKVYVAHCANCHGQPGRPGAGANAVGLWDPRTAAVRRIVAQPPGATYEEIAEGVHAVNGAPAMAGYRHVLSETEMWDLALLLRSAGQELPDPVMRLLRGPRQ